MRVSGIGFQGTYDQTWAFFWQQMEACIAVFLFSFTGFKSLFTSRGSREGHQKFGSEDASPMKRHFIPNQKVPRQGRGGTFPSIPSATLTGMRTFIRGGDHSMSLDTQDVDMLKTSSDTVRGHYHERSTDEEVRLPLLRIDYQRSSFRRSYHCTVLKWFR